MMYCTKRMRKIHSVVHRYSVASMNKSTYQIHYKLHPVQFTARREISRPRSTKIFTLPAFPPVQPTYTEAFSRRVVAEHYMTNAIDYNIVERRKTYVRTPDKNAKNITNTDISPDTVSRNEGLREAACLLGAAHLDILNGPKSTYQADYRGLKSDGAEFENMGAALKKLAQAPDNYAIDSLQRASYRAEQLTPLLKESTTRYGCNKNKHIPASAALPSIKLLKKKFGLDYKRTSYQDSYKLPKLCRVANHIRGLELHPLGSKGMEMRDNELLTRTFPNRKKTRWLAKLNTAEPPVGNLDITMDRTNVATLCNN